MVPTTFIALRGLGTSHPGVCRAEGLLEAPGAVQGKTARVSIYLPLVLVPLSHSNHTPYPSATHPTPSPGLLVKLA